ncbi:MAG: ABC transporter permease [Rhodospirillaceae bacterium]|nr:ABC transporter permease [Rhodospirillaceae bacterium]
MSLPDPAVSGARLYWALLRRRSQGITALFVLLGLMMAVYVSLSPGLLSVTSVAKLAQSWFPLALAAMAQTLVMLTGGIDLTVGAMVSLGSVLAATLVADGAPGVALGLLAVLAAGAGGGAVLGGIVALLRLPAIIVTLAGSFIVSGAALLVLPRPGGAMPAGVSEALAGDAPTALGLLVLTVLAWRLFAGAPAGIAIAAAGDNPAGAFRSGIRVPLAQVSAYAIAGGLSAFAGFFIAAQTGAGDPLIGERYTLQSITAAVLGGVSFLGGQGTMRGALAGSLLLLIIIKLIFFLGLPGFAQYVAEGLIIVGAMAAQLLRRREELP